jgi:uncharacterized protein YndB with AHSA1/START domain
MSKTYIIAEPGMPHITIMREFAASRELLLRAYTDPAWLVQWLGPRELTMTLEEFDARAGGTWRYLHHDAAGNTYGFHGIFHSAPSLDGIVQTFEFEGMPGHVSLETLTFTERDGKTLVQIHAVYQSVADRDKHLQGGMERGVNDSMERLAELLARHTPAPADVTG